MSDIWNEPQGEVQVDQPAEPPSELVVPASEAGESEKESEAVEPSGTEAFEEKTTEQAEVPGETAPEPSEVKREARRVFMEVQKMGGENAIREAFDLQSTLQDPESSTETKLQKIYQAAPRAYEDLRSQLFYSHLDAPGQKDMVVEDIFGKGVTIEKVKELLEGRVAPSPEPEYDDEFLPDSVKAEREELKQLKQQFAEMQTNAEEFSKVQAEIETQKQTALGDEFVTEAMLPSVKMMEEAGLKILPGDSPEEQKFKTWAWNTTFQQVQQELANGKDHKSLADDVRAFIGKLDRDSAWRKLPTMQARAEMETAKLLKIINYNRQKQREAEASVLNKERPPIIAGGQTSFGSNQPFPTGRDTWNDPKEAENWNDIAASLG